MKSIHKRLMAYLYMPLIFAIIGYFIIYMMMLPFQEIGLALGNMVIAESAPTFHSKLDSIFQKPEITASDIMHPTETLPISQIVIPEYETHYAEITSNRIGLSANLYFGDSNEVLRYGIGQYGGSFLPGFGGTLLLAGHNTTYFLPLKDIQVEDIIQITTNYGVYQYQVTETKILKYDDDSAFDLSQREEEQLVAYTCYPFEQIGAVTQERFFVYADKVSGPDVMDEN
jgi:LPXTG-site transpeptidase (sortase) family protein